LRSLYYVKKHVRQHLDVGDLDSAWKFLRPIATGSRYINDHHSALSTRVAGISAVVESELFPAPPHIGRAVNCFKEVMPKGSDDEYSYLSEFCHPNAFTFLQTL
jgi:hypothetical protein